MTIIDDLLRDTSIEKFKDKDNNVYSIKILGNGGNLYFQENDKGLICQINALVSMVFIKTIKNWEWHKNMNNNEIDRVSLLIKYYYKKVYNPNVMLSNDNI